MKARKLLWSQITRDDWHVARWTRTPTYPLRMHSHDFAEVFWVEGGSGVHFIQNQTQQITRGDVFFIRPEHYHGIEAAEGVTVTNLAFPITTLHFFEQRYPEYFLWGSRGQPPRSMQLTETQIEWLIKEGDKIYRLPRKPFHVERFILNLFYFVAAQSSIPLPPAIAPAWLKHACKEIQKQENFSIGISRFVQLAGRSAEHVTRVTREFLRQTPTDYVNNIRMVYAAEKLSMTDEEIIQISLACGLENLSHFYRLFSKHFDASPHQFRLKQKSLGV
jgi:AraC family cel operon transcriptional repressor